MTTNGETGRSGARDRAKDTEKVTINLGFVDLGHIDLLVREGLYSNRSDMIRTAIRNQVNAHSQLLAQSVARQSIELGLRVISRNELVALRDSGQQLHLSVLGLARIDTDIDVALARATIGSLSVLGALDAPTQLRTALADRIR